ncbi:MAG: MFS transporter, partial [Dehalococcoidia bacterium]|nr:MFS transporter [Dehalococcoidia bacterium]
HEVAGWQSVFVTLSVLGVVLAVLYLVLLPETNPASRRATRARTGVLRDYATALSSPTFVMYALVMGLMFMGQLLFISTSAFVLIEEVGLGEQAYGFSFAFVAAGIMVGASLSSRLVTRWPARRTVLFGASVATAAALVMFVLTWFFLPTVPGLLGPMFFVGVGLGATRPAAVAAAMVEFPQMAGLASALLGFTQMLVASGANIIYGRFTEPSSVALASGVAVAMVAGFVAVLLLQLAPERAASLPTRPAPASPAPVPVPAVEEPAAAPLVEATAVDVAHVAPLERGARPDRPDRRSRDRARGLVDVPVAGLEEDERAPGRAGSVGSADSAGLERGERLSRPGATLLIALVSIVFAVRMLLKYGRGRRIARD